MNIILLKKPKYCFCKGNFLARLIAMLLFMITWQTHAQTQIGADINGEQLMILVAGAFPCPPMAQQ